MEKFQQTLVMISMSGGDFLAFCTQLGIDTGLGKHLIFAHQAAFQVQLILHSGKFSCGHLRQRNPSFFSPADFPALPIV
jgi:hypothetical protein